MTNTLEQLQEHIQEYSFEFNQTEGFYHGLLKSKSDWVPGDSSLSETEKQTYKNDETGKLATIQKCVALALNLEVPVGEYVLDALDKGVPNDAKYILHSNAIDEVTHYKAFQNAATSYSVPQSLIDEATLISSNIPNEHPIFLAGYIELSMFLPILAILRNYGGSGLRLTTADVSRDESRHVNTNWHLITNMGLDKETKALRKFRYSVLDWLLSDLKDTSKSVDFWVSQSEQLYRSKKADGLSFTKAQIRRSFFELPNTVLSAY